MPPIINSEETRVTGRTRDFLIDVTGTEDRIVTRCLNVLTTSIAELDRNALQVPRPQLRLLASSGGSAVEAQFPRGPELRFAKHSIPPGRSR